MVIKTKKYKLSIDTYIQLGLKNILRVQWWVFLIMLLIMSGTLVIKTIWFTIGAVVGFILYLLFWLIQFYGMTQLENTQIIFDRVSYEITSKQIMIQITTKQGMPILWDQIQRANKGKTFFFLVISKVHFIHLPFRVFNNDHEIKFLTTILQRKGLLKK